jgi:hypothetical protein
MAVEPVAVLSNVTGPLNSVPPPQAVPQNVMV